MLQSFLERARQRQLQLLGGRDKVRGRGRGSQEADTCAEERTEAKRLERENMRLRRRMVDLEEELELARECVNSAQVSTRHIGGASNLVQSVSSPLELLGKAEVEPSPLNKLLQGAGQGAELGPGLSLSSSLVTPDPVTSTLLSTVRYKMIHHKKKYFVSLKIFLPSLQLRGHSDSDAHYGPGGALPRPRHQHSAARGGGGVSLRNVIEIPRYFHNNRRF